MTIGGKKVKVKAEVRFYLFNDALLIAAKRMGKALSKYFLALADVQLLVPGKGMPICALRFRHRDRDVCKAYRADSMEELESFANAFKREVYITLKTLDQKEDDDNEVSLIIDNGLLSRPLQSQASESVKHGRIRRFKLFNHLII